MSCYSNRSVIFKYYSSLGIHLTRNECSAFSCFSNNEVIVNTFRV